MSIKMTIDEVTGDLARMRYLFVNLYMLGTADNWVLIDGGVDGCADDIIRMAEDRFGKGAKPKAYVMTHGHFDHIGAFPELFETWDVPMYAHPAEIPFLTGKQDYPKPDPSVGLEKGVMALMSFAFPYKAVDYGDRLQPLPEDGSVPFMPDWRWIHTPGHTVGQVAYFRDSDRLLIAADAFVTTKQESVYEVMTQKEEVNGPPAYLTPDWEASRRSIERLAALNPAIAATGHGTPMRGEALTQGLQHLLAHFDEIAVPDHGKYVPKDGTTEG